MRAMKKRRVSDDGDAVSNSNADQSGIGERHGPDAGHTIGDRQAQQATASAKC